MTACPWVWVVACAFIFSGRLRAQSPDGEPAAVIEVGGAAERSFSEGHPGFGPTIAIEVTPIENWLELETGVTALFRPQSTEWSVDLLFKKPWTFSGRAELMLGIGPAWVHTKSNGFHMNAIAAELVPDFMYWPFNTHRLGLYVAPSYSYKFGPTPEHAIGITGGLLIGIL